ncbi:MAG: hypothetical protein E7580_06620 [Ruminococcaceae bacterium]|nr:hypothetical protein [Oscillospiraceae bacterium]
MGFQSRYRRKTKKDSSDKNNTTILPFWGFSYNKDHSYSHGTVYTTDSMGRPKELHGLDANYYEEFVRTTESPSKELESQFSQLLFKKYKDIWDTPYIYPSIESYYKSTLSSKVGNFFLIGALISAIPAIYFLFKVMVGPFWITALICLVCLGIGGFVSEKEVEKKYAEKPFLHLETAEKEKLWDDYLRTMTSAYGDEMGKILQEAAIKKKGKY